MRLLSSSLTLATFAAGALHASPATAVGPPSRHDDATKWEFTLQGGRADMTFDYSGTKVDTRVDMASLVLRQRIAEQIHLGVFGGWTALSQNANPATAGFKPQGYHAGISLDANFITHERWSAFGGAGYTYQRVEDDDAGQTVRLNWDEWRAYLGGSYGLGAARFYGGINYGVADGTQRTTGAIDTTAGFETSGKAGGFLGVDLRVDQDDYIGVEGRSGLDEGWLLYFRHRY
jgi:hypothetical protein